MAAPVWSSAWRMRGTEWARLEREVEAAHARSGRTARGAGRGATPARPRAPRRRGTRRPPRGRTRRRRRGCRGPAARESRRRRGRRCRPGPTPCWSWPGRSRGRRAAPRRPRSAAPRAAERPATPVPRTRIWQRSRSARRHREHLRGEHGRATRPMGEGAAEHEVDAGLGDRARVVERTPPEASSRARPPASRDRLAQLRRGPCCRAGCGRRRRRSASATCAEGRRTRRSAALGRPSGARMRATAAVSDPAAVEVGVLEHGGVVQPHAVVGAAAAAHRVLLECAASRGWSCGCRAPGTACRPARRRSGAPSWRPLTAA